MKKSTKSIKSFFKPVVTAAVATPELEDEKTGKGLVKRKFDDMSPAVDNSASSPTANVEEDESRGSIRIPGSTCTDKKTAVETVATVTSWVPLEQLRSWIPILQKEFTKPYFSRLDLFLEKEAATKKIFPPREMVFSAFSACSFDDIKVVVIGQDPYHGPNQAHGLAFSVMKPERPPPSLKNIFKEAKNDITNFSVPTHGDLSGWSKQGVFLLNTCLTVQQGNANSHQKKGWEQFITAVIRAIDQRDDGVVFLLWGKPANERCTHISRGKHTVISSSHPSPLGATKTKAPFIGSRCFSRCNEALVAMGKEPIDWNL